jgi:hypothetical protein
MFHGQRVINHSTPQPGRLKLTVKVKKPTEGHVACVFSHPVGVRMSNLQRNANVGTAINIHNRYCTHGWRCTLYGELVSSGETQSVNIEVLAYGVLLN